jgi:hypothetical protein
MPEITINKALVLKAALQNRENDLKKLLEETVTQKTRFFGSDNSEISKPKYDPKKVDAILAEIKLAIFEIDAACKESNAKTVISVSETDFKKLIGNIGSDE